MSLTGRSAPRRSKAYATALATCVVLAACSSATAPVPTSDMWRPVPVPHATGTHLLLRDATLCEGEWLLTGAVAGVDGDTVPGAWYGRKLTRIPVSGGDFYAHHAIVTTSACRNGTVVLLGTKSGGAYGLPRTATYVGTPQGVDAVRAPFELFGGPDQLFVRRFAVGPDGFQLVGARASGATVWTSSSGHHFTLHEQEPGLATGAAEQTAALDSVYFNGRWRVAGAINGRAAVFHGLETGWSRTLLTSPPGYSAAERLAATPRGLVALGLSVHSISSWTSPDGTTWEPAGLVAVLPQGTGAPFVTGLAATSDGAVAAVSDGETYKLLRWNGTWSELPPPSSLPRSSGDHTVTVSASGRKVLLVIDDGVNPRVWESTLSDD